MAEINPTAINPLNLNAQAQPAAIASTPEAASNFWGEDGFSFGDILDLINPLQHIPIIGTIYRALTGDDISTGSRIFGAGLFGGIFGLGAAVVSAIIEEISGEGIDEQIIAMFDGGETPAPDGAPAPAVLASAETNYGFERRAQEATNIDWTPGEPVPTATTVAALASVERDYAYNPAFWRRAPEDTSIFRAPETQAPVLAALPVEPPAMQTVAAVEDPLPLIPRDATWLAALPRAESAFTATAIRYVASENGLQIAQAIAVNGNLKPTSELNAFTRFAIDRYSQQALAAKFMRAEPRVVDNLY